MRCLFQVPCLCGTATCLMCSCCLSTRNSTVTRIIYSIILLLGTIVACIMLSPGIDHQLKRVWLTHACTHMHPHFLYCGWMYLFVWTQGQNCNAFGSLRNLPLQGFKWLNLQHKWIGNSMNYTCGYKTVEPDSGQKKHICLQSQWQIRIWHNSTFLWPLHIFILVFPSRLLSLRGCKEAPGAYPGSIHPWTIHQLVTGPDVSYLLGIRTLLTGTSAVLWRCPNTSPATSMPSSFLFTNVFLYNYMACPVSEENGLLKNYLTTFLHHLLLIFYYTISSYLIFRFQPEAQEFNCK